MLNEHRGQASQDTSLIEVIEYAPVQERTYTEMYQAAVGWAPGAALQREEIVRAHR